MVFAVPIGVILATVFFAHFLSAGKSVKRKYVVWGTTVLFVIAPFLSFLIGIIFANIVGDGFAGGMMMAVCFAVIFLIGLVVLLMGIVKKQVRSE
ncbi:hypothetical protein [Thalassobacillus devorans]|uniref:hypothetical protein n=1 Tax=Thalassobacillus devorans TaxID=279813 RepID=UPI000A1CAC0C|nr:hypothetical protein [Thalassobacillus devorans]